MLLVHEYACFPLDLPYLAAERSWVQKTSVEPLHRETSNSRGTCPSNDGLFSN